MSGPLGRLAARLRDPLARRVASTALFALVLGVALYRTLVDLTPVLDLLLPVSVLALVAAAVAAGVWRLRRDPAAVRTLALGAAMTFLLAWTLRGLTPIEDTFAGFLLPLLAAAAGAFALARLLPRAPRAVREWTLLVFLALAIYWLLASFYTAENATPGRYLVTVTVLIAVYALLSLGLSVEMGYAGLFNFGHVAFMLIGAYVAVLFSRRAEPALAPMLEGAGPGAILVALLVAGLAAFLAYVPLLLAASRLPLRPLARILSAALPALAVGALVLWLVLPLSRSDSENAVAFLGVLLGVAAAALGGLLLGLAALRLREDYLAIVTLGTSQILFLVALNETWLTEGSQGILDVQNPIADWARGTTWWRDLIRGWTDAQGNPVFLPIPLVHAIVGVLAVLLAYLLLEALARAPWGRVMKAIREDEDVAASLGKNVLWYKLQALMLGSAVAAVAGILFVWSVSSVYPTHFLAIVTFNVFAMLVLGGIGNHRGAILGAVLIWGIFELGGSLNNLESFRESGIQWAGPLQNIFVGLVLILVVMFRPQGAVGSKEELSLGK